MASRESSGFFFFQQGDDQKEDFSDLPPSQRRKQLIKKIDSIKKEVARETAERLNDIYIYVYSLLDGGCTRSLCPFGQKTVYSSNRFVTCFSASTWSII